MGSIFKFDSNMIHLVQEEAFRFVGAFLVMIIALITRKQYQKSAIWHLMVNMAFWQCLIPALVMEFQEPISKTMSLAEMSLAIGIGVALSTFFGIRTVLQTLPVADYVAGQNVPNRIIIKSQAPASPKIIIGSTPYANAVAETEAPDITLPEEVPVLIEQVDDDDIYEEPVDSPLVIVHANDDEKVPMVREISTLSPIAEEPVVSSKSPSKKLKSFFNKTLRSSTKKSMRI